MAVAKKQELAAPIGNPPSLEWLALPVMLVDAAYQRSTATSSSALLIKRIADAWDWRLYQPLTVARREGERGTEFYVVDGQHRLEAARRRGDIPHLPCVVTRFDGPSEEAAAFTALNRQRLRVGPMDLHRAALLHGDADAAAVERVVVGAGLRFTTTSNYAVWKPSEIFCVSTIATGIAQHGEPAMHKALTGLAEAFDGQVLRLGGMILGGLIPFYAGVGASDDFNADAFMVRLSSSTQDKWVSTARSLAATSGVAFKPAMLAVFIKTAALAAPVVSKPVTPLPAASRPICVPLSAVATPRVAAARPTHPAFVPAPRAPRLTHEQTMAGIADGSVTVVERFGSIG